MSTRRVLEWDVPVDDHPHPVGAGPVVLVACQHAVDSVQVWTEEAITAPETRQARVYGTGQTVPEAAVHLGSLTAGAGALVWHVYASPWVDGHDAKKVEP